MKTYRIFLASSSELTDERIAATAAMAEFSVLNPEHNVVFSPVKWELFASTYKDARKQSEYNATIPSCSLFMMLYWTKVGKYTNEEFDIAVKSLTGKESPKLLLLKKADGTATVDSVSEFEKKVPNGNGLFNAIFTQKTQLRSIILEELQKLFTDGYLKPGEPAILLSFNGPSAPSVFLGREKELDIIRQKLQNGGQLMLINAEGGIGKTTIAAKYWERNLYEYDHCAWLFCENGIMNALKELGPKLGVDLAGLDAKDQLIVLKRSIADIRDEFLLVLDNANDETEIEKFKKEFAGFHWHVLITSRCNGVLDEGQELTIDHLPPPLAKALFERNYKENTPEFDTLLNRLLEALQYHTLSIELFSKNMRLLRERGETLADFLKQLETEGLFLGKRSFTVVTDYTYNTRIEARTSDEILNRFYDSAKLDEEKRYWLVNMALLPAEDYSFLFLCELFDQDKFEFQELHKLAKTGWLSKSETGFKISPVIQQLALSKNAETLGDDAYDLLMKLNQILENDAYDLLNIELADAAPYVRPVTFLSRALKRHPDWNIANYNYNSGLYFRNVGDFLSARLCYENYGDIFRTLLKDDPKNSGYLNGVAVSYENIGRIYQNTGNPQKALENFEEYNRLAKIITTTDPTNLISKIFWRSLMKRWEAYTNHRATGRVL